MGRLRKSAIALSFLACAVLQSCRDSGVAPTDPIPVDKDGKSDSIPIVEGIRAYLDTAAGVITLTWKPSKYPKLEEYVIYRVQESGGSPDSEPEIGRTRDTLFVDSVRKAFSQNDFSVRYRVRIRNSEEQFGLSPKPLRVHVPPSGLIRTALNLRRQYPRDEAAGIKIKDTLRFVLEFENPTRKNAELVWSIEGPEQVARNIFLGFERGEDTLFWIPEHPGKARVTAAVTDNAGDEWSVSADVEILLDPPAAIAGKDTTLLVGESLLLSGRGRDGLGHVAKLEWDIGNKGVFVASATGDTLLPPGPYALDTAFHLLRVTDDDGLARLDTISVRRVAHAERPSGEKFDQIRFNLYAAGDYVVGLQVGFAVRFYDVARNSWTNGPMLDFGTRLQAVWTYQDRLFVLAKGPSQSILRELDTKNKAWIVRATLPSAIEYCVEALGEGFVYVLPTFGGTEVVWKPNPVPEEFWAYDLAKDAWQRKSDIPVPQLDNNGRAVTAKYWALGALGGKVYAFREEKTFDKPFPESRPKLMVFDPASEMWTEQAGESKNSGFGWSPALMTSQGKFWLLNRDGRLNSYDPATMTWSKELKAFDVEFMGALYDYSWVPTESGMFFMSRGWSGGPNEGIITRLYQYDFATGMGTYFNSPMPPSNFGYGPQWKDRLYIFAGQTGVFWEIRLPPNHSLKK